MAFFLLLALLQGPAAARAADPFAPGLRWHDPATLAEPWIPRDVAFAAGGELCWAAPAVGTPHVALYASDEVQDPAAALLVDRDYAGAIGAIRVAAGDDPDELWALVQLPAPTSGMRRTLVRAYDPRTAAGATSFSPRWTFELGTPVDAAALFASASDGGRIALAAVDTASARVLVRWIDGRTGGLLGGTELAGSSLRALRVSADGTRVALVAGGHALLLELGAPAPLVDLPLSLPTEALALSADGTRIAYADGGETRLLAEGPGGFRQQLSRKGAAGEIATRAALSADAGVLAIGWWDAVHGDAVRCEVLDTTGGAVLNQLAQQGGTSGLQNFPSGLEVSPDGGRVALGLWGVGDGQPELYLLATGDPQPLLARDLGGSVLALALDATGTRVALAKKHAHANVFGTTGEVELYDTGERDLQLLGATRPGGSLALAFRAPAPGTALFGLGLAAAAPRVFPVARGELWLDLLAPTAFWSVPLAPSGGAQRADLVLGLAPATSLVGLPLALQAASLGASGLEFSTSWVRPQVF